MSDGPTDSRRRFEGSCHCGAVTFTFETAVPPARWQTRACQCTFCRRHAARTISDHEGSVAFRVDEAALQRYRFGLGTAEFFVCRNCGVYLAAVLTSARGQFATLNINALRDPVDVESPVKVSYDRESVDERQRRREEGWTPVREIAITSGP